MKAYIIVHIDLLLGTWNMLHMGMDLMAMDHAVMDHIAKELDQSATLSDHTDMDHTAIDHKVMMDYWKLVIKKSSDPT